ncbi:MULTISPECIES: hypothetical protein [unclassified Colwellia]|nr:MULTISPECIES: hypothetical protein [unclassified Colwellia]MBA6361065.1 hypothetical protein [Colwellia sp. BRX8-6]MBA6375357.1 hypothetical protein [Colwellia sp. BRX8-2]
MPGVLNAIERQPILLAGLSAYQKHRTSAIKYFLPTGANKGFHCRHLHTA